MYELSAEDLDLVAGGEIQLHLGTDGVWTDGSAKDYATAVKEGWNWMAVNLPLSAPSVISVAMLQLSRWARQ